MTQGQGPSDPSRRPSGSTHPPPPTRRVGRVLLALVLPTAIAAGVGGGGGSAPAHQAPHSASETDAAGAGAGAAGREGAESPSFQLPEVGTYELPPIAHVPDFELLNRAGEPERLPGLAPGQVALIAFIYTRCSDGRGCPAVLATLQRVDRLLAANAELAPRVRQFAVSFDPHHDTPERMDALARSLRPRADWRFCTAASPTHLAPLLEAFGQDALPLVSEAGVELGLYRHVLKVFLVDARGAVRNVYSAGFLSPELLLIDAETVLREEAAPRATRR